MEWQPSASRQVLVARAKLNRIIREFFEQRAVLEVETPLLCTSTATEPQLHSWQLDAKPNRYLQTSPEFAMKRLLAADSGPIYQLCKAFRQEQSSSRHQPEFSILEWYRPGWSLDQLMEEISDLIADIRRQFHQDSPTIPITSYASLFQQQLGLCPHSSPTEALRQCATQRLCGDFQNWDRTTLLDLLMSHLIEPSLPATGQFVTEFPASQAALAKLTCNSAGIEVAHRVELFIHGLEIANGYQELTDPDVLRVRSARNIEQRATDNSAQVPMPGPLLAAMDHGLPECAGVALGVDRLLMTLLDIQQIDKVLTFPENRA